MTADKSNQRAAVVILTGAGCGAGGHAAAADTADLPYVYTDWKQFTVADGLPNDHVFAVEVAGPTVWVGAKPTVYCGGLTPVTRGA